VAEFATSTGRSDLVAIRATMVEHGFVTNDISALVVVIVVVCMLGLIMRWVFKPSRPRTGRAVDATESADLGMLDVLAADLPRSDAMALRATLGDAGIRSSMSRRSNGDVDVLVFHDDLPRARELLG
jgi:ABC-type tungstate transport system permease subunit